MARLASPPLRRYAPVIVVPTERDILDDYRRAWAAIEGDLERVIVRIEAAREAGEEINRAWLSQQARLNDLAADVERRMYAVNSAAARKLERERAGLVRRGVDDAAREIGALGVSSRFPERAFERLAYARNLPALYAANGARAAQRARTVLIGGLARGRNPRAVARQLRREVGGSAARALMIARTEMMEVYRDAAMETYRANRDVLSGWTWLAESDACPTCAELDGQTFPIDEEFTGPHPNCRCTALPVVRDDMLGEDEGESMVSVSDRANVRLQRSAGADAGLSSLDAVLVLPRSAPAFDVQLGSGASHFQPLAPGGKVAIRGDYRNLDSAGTFVHEFGHYLDWWVGGEDAYKYASQAKLAEMSVEMRGVMKAIGNSPEYDLIRSDKYRGKRVELFARSFEQYVATVTGDVALLDKIAQMRRLDDAAAYWTVETFAPIRAAFDALFRSRGMLRQRAR